LFTEISGATSLEMLSQDLNTALAMDDVKTILFDIDSPGGQVNGTAEFVDMVYAAREKKTIKAYIQGSGASGAYWIASAADEIIISETAMLGSIGVMAVYHDMTQREAAQGIKTLQFISSVSPMKNPDPDSDAGRAEIQGIVDSMAGVMVNSIARNRGTDEETVVSEFGGGGIFVGALAVGAGLADRIGNFEEVLEKAKQSNTHSTGGRRMGKQQGENDNAVTITVEGLRETSPETYKAVFALGKTEGLTEGATAERERIQSIESLKAPGFESVIADEKYKPEATRDSVSHAILEAQEAKRGEAATATEKDATKVGEESAKVKSGDDDPNKAEQDQAVKAMVEGADEKRS
jgi:ClpP class serine protease